MRQHLADDHDDQVGVANAAIAALSHSPMSGFDGLHESVFSAAGELASGGGANEAAAAMADTTLEWRWLPWAAFAVAAAAAALSAIVPWGFAA